MQDAQTGSAGREALLGAPDLRSLRMLNRRFLELAGAAAERPGGWSLRVPPDLSHRIAGLSDEHRAALGACPYALFDLRFADEAHWLAQLHSGAGPRVRDGASADLPTMEFVRLAIFYGWHLASSRPMSARLVLGMTARTVSAFAAVTLDGLPELIESQRHHLSMRWAGCKPFWLAITSATHGPASPNLRRAQLFGLQVAAASRLSSV